MRSSSVARSTVMTASSNARGRSMGTADVSGVAVLLSGDRTALADGRFRSRDSAPTFNPALTSTTSTRSARPGADHDRDATTKRRGATSRSPEPCRSPGKPGARAPPQPAPTRIEVVVTAADGTHEEELLR